MVTKSGLIFAAGTADANLWVLDSATGKTLAKFPLPCVAGALPMIYTMAGKEYVVISCGGHGFISNQYDNRVVAFALSS